MRCLVGAARLLPGEGTSSRGKTSRRPNSRATNQGLARPKLKDGRSSAKDGAPKRLVCRAVKKEMRKSCVECLQEVYSPILSCIDRRIKDGCEL